MSGLVLAVFEVIADYLTIKVGSALRRMSCFVFKRQSTRLYCKEDDNLNFYIGLGFWGINSTVALIIYIITHYD